MGGASLFGGVLTGASGSGRTGRPASEGDAATIDSRAPILLYGPTASGKSALSAALAERLGGAVVNADSQQVYGDWRILSARPSPEEAARAPHLLYGHVALEERYSVGRWLGEVETVLRDCRRQGLVPVVTGGTGLYFRALTRGLAHVPPVPEEIRHRGAAELARLGLARFAGALAEREPAAVAGLDTANPARVLRAWEVLEATGRPLGAWQAAMSTPLLPLGQARAVVLAPPREWLRARCDARLDAMIAGGALDEVRRVLARDLPWSLPGMKAVGARELARHLSGELSLADAAEAAKTATRRYAKRQTTWARGQMSDWRAVPATGLEERVAAVLGNGR